MTEALVPITASTDRFVQTVKALNDTEVGGTTLVPPWTRGHVITHVARAADSLCRLLTWARTGVETPQYASMDARAAEIEAGARRPAHELVADVVTSAECFDEAVRSLPDAAWNCEVRMRTGELRTPGTLVLARLRELEIHHADLAAGYGFADVPPKAARWIIDDFVDAQRRREGVPPLRIEATDTDLTHELGTGGPTIRGTQADLLGWLTGRTIGATLSTSQPGPVPTAPYWI
ncbi:maleylpyruvate isomerase family mycothiol-dependent enzyme [Streptomyces inhibens]|uniref:maleylpyruvate isomerase family mycothiol-dependent enzyme n=1 Tax=Streptomyces inhibens TaxID=2293571 RepID=UPI001EE69B58|nr:maleylpyruvate isomerase family mycothiol-dependent enzyme [Streptomyces inhibens]UKY47456.1 maleylpyruvate isomerase family mycothiol-dependent enzyme [Streptomyces inhibens]